LVEIDEPTLGARLKQLNTQVDKLQAKKTRIIKSKIQTYDIRDCEEYYGVLELETLLRKVGQEKEKEGFNLAYDDIRRSSSKIYVFGSSFRKTNSKGTIEGESPTRKPMDVKSDSFVSDLEDLISEPSDDDKNVNKTNLDINDRTQNFTI